MRQTGPVLPPTSPEIPDKLYFRIGEVAHIAGVEPYVLRFWETEFPQLAPKKTGKGHRLYRRKEVELVLEVKRLLYEKRFTIEGARLYFDQLRKKPAARPINQLVQSQPNLFGDVPPGALVEIRRELAEILELLR